MTGRAQTYSSIHYQWTYDVFINFRGEDTRYGFTGSLNKTLKEKGIRTFFDDKEIRIGDEIEPTLFEAIKESRMAITIFSKDYASSRFCLDELVHIHKYIMKNGRLVWPIFYDVEPSEVRHQRGKYGEALVRHEQNSRANEEKIKSWKQALFEVANRKGSSHDPRKKYDHELIDEIVNNILKIIKRVPLNVAEYPVGLNDRVEKINYLVQLGSNDEVIMIGIYGIGGIGKTTIASAVYNAIADNFDYLCYLDDINGESGKYGLKQEQARMLSRILGQKVEIEDIDEGVELIKRIVKDKKILLVLDNIHEQKQLQKLAGACEWFGSRSRIIITTRDKHLLRTHRVERIYEMEGLNYEESLELLSWKAFGNMQVDDSSYKDVVDDVISYASGLPLAIELIGSNLYGKSVREWESMLDGCKRIPHDKIHQILKVSYDGLQELEKEVFLDIACFYNGNKLEEVKKMVKSAHHFDPDYHIGVLKDKCLVTIVKHFFIKMHDLVQDMGREIVRQVSPEDPGKRNRLWSSEDILYVLENNEGTNKVIMIIQVEMSECIEVNWDGDGFKNMKRLKVLIPENAKFSQAPTCLPNSLRVLRWIGYPSSSLPSDFRPKDLAEFDVGNSHFSSLETISKITPNVSVLRFGWCEYIRKIPNLSCLSNLKVLGLGGCENLTEIDDSIGQLPKLETLNVYACAQLETFPRELNTPSLVNLLLEFCHNLNYFPEIVAKDMKISDLSLRWTGIGQLPPSIENLTQLTEIYIVNLRRDRIRSTRQPSSTCLLPKLQKIYIGGYHEMLMEVESIRCPNIQDLIITNCEISNENLRFYLTSFSNVHFLDLTESNFTVLPSCIEDCQNLYKLLLNECKHLIHVEKVPPSIEILEAADCRSLSSESRKLLLSKELLAYVVPINNELSPHDRKAYLCVPCGSIPKWFYHYSKGPSISFWFREPHFPILCICAIVKPATYDGLLICARVFINDKMALINNFPSFTYSIRDEDHIIVHYLRDSKIDEFFEADQGTHVKIDFLSRYDKVDVKETGIYVIKDERTNMV